MKKIIASLAAIATVLSLSVVSFAATPGDSNAKVEEVVKVEEGKATEFSFETGAKVEAAAGAFEAGKDVKIELQAQPVTDTAAIATEVKAVSEAPGGKDVTFDTVVSISASSDGVAVQPSGDITITIAYEGDANAVAYVTSEGKVETYELTKTSTTASFTIKHFSDFYLVKVAADQLDTFLGKSGDNTPGSSSGDNNQPTGVAIAIIPAAIAAAAVVVSKKRK